MRGLAITSGVTCLAFASAACSNTLAAETDEQLIHETYLAWVAATNEKDIEKWSAFLATNPYFHPADSSPLASTEEVVSYYARSFADPKFSLGCKQEYVDVSESGEMAWSRGFCRATFTGRNLPHRRFELERRLLTQSSLAMRATRAWGHIDMLSSFFELQ